VTADSKGPTDVRVCLVTSPPDRAASLARELVERGLAACVNVIGNVTSVYRWQGKIHEDGESLLVIKTSAARIEELEATVLKLHPYDVPEFLVLEVASGAAGYLDWVLGATNAPETGSAGSGAE